MGMRLRHFFRKSKHALRDCYHILTLKWSQFNYFAIIVLWECILINLITYMESFVLQSLNTLD